MFPRRLPLVVSSTLASAVLSLALPAWGQTVTVSSQSIQRKYGLRPDTQYPYYFSYADCKRADEISFNAVLGGSFIGNSLEVWIGAGTDCTDNLQRTGASPTCWQVYKTAPQLYTQTVTIKVRDIVGRHKSNEPSWGPNSGTEQDCEFTGDPAEGTAISMYFILLAGGGTTVAGTPAKYDTKIDMVGPPSPSGLSAGVGDTRLIMDWTPPTSTDLLGVNIYCDPKPGSTTPGVSDSGTGGSGGTTATGGAGGTTATGGTSAGGTDAGTDAAAGGSVTTGGAAGTTSAGGTGASGGSGGTGGGTTFVAQGGNPGCPSDVLIAGLRPPSGYQCGSATGKFVSGGNAEGLINGVNYSVAVAATDAVGNTGPLSAIACGSPQPVDDFFDLYRKAGGKGGGGFCAFGREPTAGAGMLLLGALGLLFARRRTRR